MTKINKLYKFTKSWITSPRGSTDSKRRGRIDKENGGAGTSGSFGDGGGTVFTSTNSGIFSPTYGDNGRRNKKKKSGIERLASFVRGNSPSKKMVKDFTSFAKEQLTKDEIKFRQQTSGEDINPQTKKIEGWRNPVEFDAEPDKDAAVEQKDVEQKIRSIDDKDNTIQLRWGSGGYTTDALHTGGEKDDRRGKIQELEEETEEREFVK